MTEHALRPILSVEDSDEDFFSLCFTLQVLGVANPVERCANSRIARARLESKEGCALAREAAVILLDLNMPGVDGRQLLSLFRKRERDVPVVILSTSSHPSDIAYCQKEGANDYLVKPLELDRWRDMVGQFAEKWLPNERKSSTADRS